MRYTEKSILKLRSGQTTWRVWVRAISGPAGSPQYEVVVDRKCMQGKRSRTHLGLRIGPDMFDPKYDYEKCGYLTDRLGRGCFSSKRQADAFAKDIREGLYPEIVKDVYEHHELDVIFNQYNEWMSEDIDRDDPGDHSESELEELMSFDAAEEAEKLTGDSIHDPNGKAQGAFMRLHVQNNAWKRSALEARGDTVFGSELQQYIEVITGLGFEKLLEVPFEYTPNYAGTDWSPLKNQQFFYGHHDGMLLIFDTYGEENDRVNGAKMYYCWKPNSLEWNYPGGVTHSGSFYSTDPSWYKDSDRNVDETCFWFGDHDAREGLKFKIERLRRHGKFMSPWPVTERQIHIWFCHHGDHNEMSVARNADRSNSRMAEESVIANALQRWHQFPDWAREMTKPVEQYANFKIDKVDKITSTI